MNTNDYYFRADTDGKHDSLKKALKFILNETYQIISREHFDRIPDIHIYQKSREFNSSKNQSIYCHLCKQYPPHPLELHSTQEL